MNEVNEPTASTLLTNKKCFIFSAPFKGWRGVEDFFCAMGAVAKRTASLLIKSAGLLDT